MQWRKLQQFTTQRLEFGVALTQQLDHLGRLRVSSQLKLRKQLGDGPVGIVVAVGLVGGVCLAAPCRLVKGEICFSQRSETLLLDAASLDLLVERVLLCLDLVRVVIVSARCAPTGEVVGFFVLRFSVCF